MIFVVHTNSCLKCAVYYKMCFNLYTRISNDYYIDIEITNDLCCTYEFMSKLYSK